MDPGTDTAEWLQTYGPWAVVVLCIAAIAVLWRRLNDERAARDVQLAALHKEHKAELGVLVDRLIAARSSEGEKLAQLVEQNARVIEGLSRRMMRRGGDDS